MTFGDVLEVLAAIVSSAAVFLILFPLVPVLIAVGGGLIVLSAWATYMAQFLTRPIKTSAE